MGFFRATKQSSVNKDLPRVLPWKNQRTHKLASRNSMNCLDAFSKWSKERFKSELRGKRGPAGHCHVQIENCLVKRRLGGILPVGLVLDFLWFENNTTRLVNKIKLGR